MLKLKIKKGDEELSEYKKEAEEEDTIQKVMNTSCQNNGRLN